MKFLSWNNIEHPNIIKWHFSFVQDQYLYIVMDYAEGGDLSKLIEKQASLK